MIWLEFIVVLFAIFLGIRLGGIAIGYAGGVGLVILTFMLGLKSGAIPWDVILIIMSVIGAIAAMQVAGGMDYLVHLAEKVIRSNPKHITYLGPTVTYVLTLFAGTGHTAYSVIPVIVEVAKEENIKPSLPLSIAVVASQVAITASPVSAAVIAMSGILEKSGVTYLQILLICIPTTFAACMIAAFIFNIFAKTPLSEDPEYKKKLAEGSVALSKKGEQRNISPKAKLSVLIFLLGVFCAVLYATLVSDKFGIIKNPVASRNDGIIMFMLVAACFIVIFCKINPDKILVSSTFKAGMNACVCILGVAWLGDTFVSNHLEEVKSFANNVLSSHPWALAVVLLFASALLYSQAATTKALIPSIVALGVSPITVIASFAAVSGLFIFPTYPTLLASLQMDDSGSTRIGKFIFNHSFFLPGVVVIAIAVGLGFLFAPIVI